MTTIVCIKVGTKYSAEYVNKLHLQIEATTSVPYRFLCITEDQKDVQAECIPLLCTDLTGWWPKLSLFSQNAYSIQGKILFLDLDVIVVGSLDEMLTYPLDFCIIQDFYYPETYNSSVFLLQVGSLPHVWDKFSSDYIQGLRQGDQQWILQQVPGAHLWPKDWCVSYKLHAKTNVPPNARVVCFHGKPKPPEVHIGSWVDKYWKCLV